MTPQRWQLVKEVFEAALAHQPAERASFLRQRCGADTDLADEAESLIRSHEFCPDYLEREQDASDLFPLRPKRANLGSNGQRIDRYRLIRPIASGGMGVVYLASRDDQAYEQHVALKLLRWAGTEPPAERADQLRRFRQERQALANLAHPNIARLLDGGASDADVPYLVMEFIEGRPINEYCKARALAPREILRLFLQVGAAVSYAHQNLVIHRDLKPSNVLVTADGLVKLLDFGIAKLLDDGNRQQATQTRGLSAMTPRYASPEQLQGRPISTSSDVYSLGVMLYELLTGKHPAGDANLPAAELVRAVCELTPPSPSSVLRGATALRAGLNVEIDTIVLKALRKEPAERYSSVEQMCADIERYLQGMPLLARRGAFGYAARKFVQRHLAAVATAALLVLTLIGALLGVLRSQHSTAQAWTRAEQLLLQEQQQRRLSELQQARAESAEKDAAQRAATAQRVADVLAGTLDAANPYTRVAGTDAASAVHEVALTRAAERIDAELADEPLTRAALLMTLANVYRRRGDDARAEPLAEQVLAIRATLLGAEHPDTARAEKLLAECLITRECNRKAEALLRHALQVLEAQPDSEPAQIAYMQDALGRALMYQERFDEAEPRMLSAIAQLRREGLNGPGDLAELLHNYGMMLNHAGRYAEAEVQLRQALDIREKKLPEGHPRTATTLHGLGAVLTASDQAAQAEPLLRRAVAYRQAALPAEHPLTASARAALGACLSELGCVAEAEPLLRDALEKLSNLLGPGHRRSRTAAAALATLLERSGRFAEAAQLRSAAAESPPAGCED